jgi:hypothetical protein
VRPGRPPSHNPAGYRPVNVVPGEHELPPIFEALWSRRFTGKILLHFTSGYPAIVDELPHSRGRRWHIRRPPP